MAEPRWTLTQGLTRMVRVLLLRAAIVIPLWVGLVYLLTPWINTFTSMGQRGFGVFCIPGILIGAVIGHRLIEAAGFAHWIIMVAGIVVAAGAIAAGVAIADSIQTINQRYSVFSFTALFAAIWIARVTMRDS